MNKPLITLGAQQSAALDAAIAWLNDPGDKQLFRIDGYAGTGKTMLARLIAEQVSGKVVAAAPTGKAALNLRRAGFPDASTLHALIYTSERGRDGTFYFSLNEDSDAIDADLIVLDEVYMLDEQILHDVLSFGRPVLSLGDPGQLPPVNGESPLVGVKPDVMLTEIHRQGKNSPILILARLAREGNPLPRGSWAGSKVVAKAEIPMAELLAADQVLVGKKQTRRELTAELRKAEGRAGPMPEVGERLISRRNDYGRGFLNGESFRVLETFGQVDNGRGIRLVRLRVVSEDVPDAEPAVIRVHPKCFTHLKEEVPYQELKGSDYFEHGRVLTVHLAQGSQWPHVVLIDESHIAREDAHRWLYTGITRAAERVTVGQV